MRRHFEWQSWELKEAVGCFGLVEIEKGKVSWRGKWSSSEINKSDWIKIKRVLLKVWVDEEKSFWSWFNKNSQTLQWVHWVYILLGFYA